jgi:hypothetical protein
MRSDAPSGGSTFCRQFFFVIVSVLTIGSVLAILVTCFYFSAHFKLFSAESEILIALIISLVVTVLLLCFTVWVSCHAATASRCFLAVVFLAFDGGLFALSIFALVREGAVIGALGDFIDHPQNDDQRTVVRNLEATFKCCGWDLPPACGHPDSCKDSIGGPLHTYWKAAAGATLGVAVLLLVAVGFAFKFACARDYAQLPEKANDGKIVGTSPGPTDYTHTW